MTASSLDTPDARVDDFLAQKRIAATQITQRIVHDCVDAGVHRVWMHQSLGNGTSVSPAAVEYCRRHDISVIAGACPMMFGDGVDFGHTCMRGILKVTGRLPT